MRSFTLAFAVAAAGSAAAAQGTTSAGGRISWDFGSLYLYDYDPLEIELFGNSTVATGLSGSFGFSTETGFGMQLDLSGARAVFTDISGGFTESRGASLRVNYDFGAVVAGGFVGTGESTTLASQGINTTFLAQWYGVEAAGTFGDWQIVGQAGRSSSTSALFGSTAYANQPMGALELRYFLGDDTMFSAGAAYAAGRFGSDPLQVRSLKVAVTTRLFETDLFATAQYRQDSYRSDAPMQLSESRAFLGLTLLFGGASLRETYTGITPMLDNTLARQIPAYYRMEP